MARKKMKVVTGARQYTTGLIFPPEGDFECWTFTVPNGVSVGSIVEVGSQNTSNASCGEYKMYLKRPDGTKTEKSFGPQPGISSLTQVGEWKLFIKTVTPCKDFGLIINVRY